ncbi:MAG: DUF4105 domain-containing protein [Planctomycetota bacterium]
MVFATSRNYCYARIALFAAIVLPFCNGCSSLPTGLGDKLLPSNNRDWVAEQAVMPRAEMTGSEVTLRNIRNCNYVTNDDYVVDYYDRNFELSEIQSVDFIVVPFKVRQLAHTMLSFGLQDGTYLCVSVEVRKEAGEKYNPLSGLARQFELMYVLADEKDLIRVRTRHRDAEVYVYPSIANPQQAQTLFIDVVSRMNKLAVDPEFYHSIKNNCTTNLAGHVNTVSSKKIHYGWKVLLPGFSAKYAYDLGLLDNSIPFEELTEIALVNDLADTHYDAADFSQRIRSRHGRIERFAEHKRRFEDRFR